MNECYQNSNEQLFATRHFGLKATVVPDKTHVFLSGLESTAFDCEVLSGSLCQSEGSLSFRRRV